MPEAPVITPVPTKAPTPDTITRQVPGTICPAQRRETGTRIKRVLDRVGT